jgi:hypothetical protein
MGSRARVREAAIDSTVRYLLSAVSDVSCLVSSVCGLLSAVCCLVFAVW